MSEPGSTIAGLSGSLVQDRLGIWRSRQCSAVSYPEDGNQACFQIEDRSFWFRHRNSCIMAAMHRFQPRCAVLDVGGGNGYVARRMLDEGHDATLLEPGYGGALNARAKRHLPNVICSTLADSELPPASIAAIGLFDVLEHIQDDAAFVGELHRVLKPDGLLYVTVPAEPVLWSASDITAGHVRRYTAKALARVLGAGFDALYLTHLFAALAVPVATFRTLPFRLGLARRARTVADDARQLAADGFAAGVVAKALGFEVAWIRRGWRLPCGTSLLLVARKSAGRARAKCRQAGDLG